MGKATPFEAAVDGAALHLEAMTGQELTPEFMDSVAESIAPKFVEGIIKDAS